MLTVCRVCVVSYTLVLIAALSSACGPRCATESVCAVLGSGANFEVCNGDDWVACDDSTRGVAIACVNSPRTAVCSPSGWTFENAAR